MMQKIRDTFYVREDFSKREEFIRKGYELVNEYYPIKGGVYRTSDIYPSFDRMEKLCIRYPIHIENVIAEHIDRYPFGR